MKTWAKLSTIGKDKVWRTGQEWSGGCPDLRKDIRSLQHAIQTPQTEYLGLIIYSQWL